MELHISPAELLASPPEVLDAMLEYLSERAKTIDRERRMAEWKRRDA